jgi:hypothetical protein
MRFALLQEGAKTTPCASPFKVQEAGQERAKSQGWSVGKLEATAGRPAVFGLRFFAPRLTSRRHDAVASSAGGLAPLMTSQSVNAGSPKKVG